MTIKDRIATYVADHKERLIDELQAFLRQKSISTEDIGMEDCAAMLERELRRLGFEAGIARVPGAMPAVWGVAGGGPDGASGHGPGGAGATRGGRRMLVYGHYDVQSPQPLELWQSDPFGADIRGGFIYARGATDDKGNLWANIKAAETVQAVLGEIPLQLRFLFEGEEEIGSPNLAAVMRGLAGRLSSDISIVCDRGVHESGRPQIYLGNKGILSAEITATKGRRDVHSGHAPLIPNAAYDLMALITSMRAPDGTILVDGYLDNVKGPDADEAALLDTIPFDRDEFNRGYGLKENLGPKTARGMLERLLYYPTANVSGFKAGWLGERGKTIIPHTAWTRLDLRLVHAQTLTEAKEKLAAFIDRSPYGPFDYRISGENEEYKVPPSNPAVRTAIATAADVYGSDPVVWPLLDGSGPLCLFPRYLGAPVFMIGLAAAFSTANTHAPNENISIEQYLKGIEYMANLMVRYAELS